VAVVCLAVRVVVKAGHEQRAAELFRSLSDESRKEPGCIMYLAHQQKDHPRRFLVYEQYTDEAALKIHHNSPHFKKYAAEGVYTIIEFREADLYLPI
jgi:(4S)-4-hydroxy-5-phosphonooxypentane-2,3-dione isomerase